MAVSDQSIGFKLSAICGYCGIRSAELRTYHAAGLLPEPALGKSKRPVYSIIHMERILAIRAALKLGLTMSQVALLLSIRSDGSEGAKNSQPILALVDDIRARVVRMDALAETLSDLVRSPYPESTCTHIQALLLSFIPRTSTREAS